MIIKKGELFMDII